MSSPISPKPVRPSLHPLRWVALIGILMFAIAPWLTALDLIRKDGAPDQYPGWPLLLFGWLGVFGVLDLKFYAVGWLANPLLIIGTLLLLFDHFDKRRLATIVLFAAAMFAVGGFLLKEIMMDEGGNTAAVVGHNIGFWLWMAAIWFNFLVALVVQSLSIPTPAESNQ
ncbi:MAG: hypothetical protein WCH39_20685 [Schlesneria sp.]